MGGLTSTEFGVHVEQRIGKVCLVTRRKVFATCRRILEALGIVSGKSWFATETRDGLSDDGLCGHLRLA